MRRIDLLRDEDELRHPHAATSSRVRAANSSGVCSHAARGGGGAVGERLRERAVGEHAHERVRERRGSPGGTSSPLRRPRRCPGSRRRARRRRRAAAERLHRARAAAPPRTTAARAPSAASSAAATCRRRHLARPTRAPGKSRTSASATSRSASRSDEVQRRLRHARRGEPPRVGEPVHVLVPLEHADEERARLRRAAARGGDAGTPRRRSTRESRRPARRRARARASRERRDGAHRVRAAHRRGRDRRAEPAEQPAQRASRTAASPCPSRRAPRRRRVRGSARARARASAARTSYGLCATTARRAERAELAAVHGQREPEREPSSARGRSGGTREASVVVSEPAAADSTRMSISAASASHLRASCGVGGSR